MKCHELFEKISQDLSDEIMLFLHDEERDVYKQVVATLAAQRKLRPVFVTRKKRADQFAWLRKTLQLRSMDGVGEHVLQAWLMKSEPDMLVDFLDDLDIRHDGKGVVDDLPEELGIEPVKKAVDSLLENYTPEKVTLYLNLFQMQEEGGWASIDEVLAENSKLGFAGDTKAESTPEAAPAAEEKVPAEEKAGSDEEE